MFEKYDYTTKTADVKPPRPRAIFTGFLLIGEKTWRLDMPTPAGFK
jgi:hypothetical protein